MQYEVCPGQMVINSGTRYPAGSLVPPIPESAELVAAGVIRVVDDALTVRPSPVVKVVGSAPHAAFNPADPSSVSAVPLRWLSACLATVDDLDVLAAMHAADSRKGGRDKIEERIGEVKTA